jgi:hypothetical protein
MRCLPNGNQALNRSRNPRLEQLAGVGGGLHLVMIKQGEGFLSLSRAFVFPLMDHAGVSAAGIT